MSLQSQLNKASSIFVKAKKKYEQLVNDCQNEVEGSTQIIEWNKGNIVEAQAVLAKAQNAIDKIDEIIG